MVALVLIPGLGSDGAVWRPTIEALSTSATCQIGDTLSDASHSEMARRILHDAPDRFALAGVSMGGMVALEVIRAAPERITGLALIDTNAWPDTPEQRARREGSAEAALRSKDFPSFVAQGTDYMLASTADKTVREAVTAMGVRVGAATYARQTKAIIARNDLRPVLTSIAVPTIVVVGEADEMTPPSFSEAIHKAVSGSELHIIPDCGHLPPIEKPQQLAKLLRDWLAKL